jgi:hypothetical protein
MQSPKRYVLKNKQDGVLDKDKTKVNVQKHNICSNVYHRHKLLDISETKRVSETLWF